MSAFLSICLFVLGCGGGAAHAPFTTPRAEDGHPLIEEVADCGGAERAVRDCVVDRVCNFSFDAATPTRFHLRPVGATPWIQVTRRQDGSVSDIELARSGPDGTEYEVGLSCEVGASPGGEDTLLLAIGEDESPPSELLTLAESERTHEAARAAFESADDGALVFQHAMWLARSSAAADRAVLLEALRSRAVVELLGNTTLDRGPRMRLEPHGHRWPLAQILFTLRDDPGEGGASSLVELAAEPLWSESLDMPDSQVDWLLLALAAVRPPTPEVIRYWRAHARPDDGFVELTVRALVDNGSDEARSLYTTLLRDRGFEHDVRRGWLRSDLAARRHEPAILEVAEHLAAAGRLPPRLHRELLEDLFGDWTHEIRPDTALICPALERVPPEAASILRRIGGRALAQRLPASTRAVVQEGLERLGPREGEAGLGD